MGSNNDPAGMMIALPLCVTKGSPEPHSVQKDFVNDRVG